MLKRDDRTVTPYSLKQHQIANKPLSCLWYELKWHGYGPSDAELERVVLEALRDCSFDFWKIRARIHELRKMPRPAVVTT